MIACALRLGYILRTQFQFFHAGDQSHVRNGSFEEIVEYESHPIIRDRAYDDVLPIVDVFDVFIQRRVFDIFHVPSVLGNDQCPWKFPDLNTIKFVQVQIHRIEYGVIVVPAANEGLGLDGVVAEIKPLPKIRLFTSLFEIWHDSALDTVFGAMVKVFRFFGGYILDSHVELVDVHDCRPFRLNRFS